MIFVYFKLNQIVKVFLVLLFVAFMSACGGGDSDDSTSPVSVVAALPPAVEPAPVVEPTSAEPASNVQENDYTPDPIQLSEVAETSQDLFVDANFSFDSHREVIFDISATDANNLPLSNLILAISIIDKDIVAYDDPRLQLKSLLSMAKTDANGLIYVSLELPQTASKELLELNAVGMQNDVIKSIAEDGYVLHHFAQQ